MSDQKRSVAILTSGGDCAGMNAAVATAVKMALYRGCNTYVVREGYEGLVKGNGDAELGGQADANAKYLNDIPLSYNCGDFFRLGDFDGGDSSLSHRYIVQIGWDDVRGWSQMGGTLIGTARCKEFREREGRRKAAYNLIRNGIDSLVVCGGDGSLTGADILRTEWPELVAELRDIGKITDKQAERFIHLHIAGLVGSIDNDLTCTELTIGASTALQRICESLNSISSTASSHSRAFVVEVMGRHCGWLALMAGIASGADYVFIPERPPPDDWRHDLKEKLLKTREQGKRKSIVVVAEGAIDCELEPITSDMVATELRDLHLDTRVTTLGHTQRGGSPDANDRILATLQAIDALEALMEDAPGKPSYIIGITQGRVKRLPLRESIAHNNLLPEAIKEKRFSDAMKLRGKEFHDGIKTFLYNSIQMDGEALSDEPLTIGIMHVGAPAGGINAAARTAVRFCLHHGHTPLLIQNGFKGLIKGQIDKAKWLRVDSWASSGGSELGINRLLPDTDFSGILSEARHNYAPFRIPMIVLPATLSNNLPLNEGITLTRMDEDLNEKASSVYKASFISDIFGKEGGEIFDSRYERLSHQLQGDTPSPLDRVEASRLAVKCCEFLEKHAGSACAWDPPSAMITIRQGEIQITPVAQMVEHADFAYRRGDEKWWSACEQYVDIISGRLSI
ncbi:6-phosphofructokinase [Malassezia caprae]|uniref:6-phosphofructokinase n=1 Tax=Malassezia caprae TaxID=1381934 RepID=A0AAF0IX31_9BASI|nr:6-phosphofructokinase [Malassezia caprae]